MPLRDYYWAATELDRYADHIKAQKLFREAPQSTSVMPLFSYIDESEHLRGPFEGVQMHYWYQRGYLPSTLQVFVHYGLYGKSSTLEELRRRNGDSNPFLEVMDRRLSNPTTTEKLKTNVMATGSSYEASSSSLDSGSHSSVPFALKNVTKTRLDIEFV